MKIILSFFFLFHSVYAISQNSANLLVNANNIRYWSHPNFSEKNKGVLQEGDKVRIIVNPIEDPSSLDVDTRSYPFYRIYKENDPAPYYINVSEAHVDLNKGVLEAVSGAIIDETSIPSIDINWNNYYAGDTIYIHSDIVKYSELNKANVINSLKFKSEVFGLFTIKKFIHIKLFDGDKYFAYCTPINSPFSLENNPPVYIEYPLINSDNGVDTHVLGRQSPFNYLLISYYHNSHKPENSLQNFYSNYLSLLYKDFDSWDEFKKAKFIKKGKIYMDSIYALIPNVGNIHYLGVYKSVLEKYDFEKKVFPLSDIDITNGTLVSAEHPYNNKRIKGFANLSSFIPEIKLSADSAENFLKSLNSRSQDREVILLAKYKYLSSICRKNYREIYGSNQYRFL